MYRSLSKLFFIILVFLATPSLRAGNLKVTITPASAVTAGAQWRVDGGVWRASGTTASNLTNTAHSVQFKTITGWMTPAAQPVTPTGTTTSTLTGNYIKKASLTVSLTPATAQWRVDSGSWRASGTTATGLNVGTHTLEFNAVTGYTTLPKQTITLTAGQALALTRTYVAKATLSMTLTPSSAKWRVNGGVWRASGTSVSLDAGAKTIDYQAVAGYTTLPSETVTLTGGQTRNLKTNLPCPSESQLCS
jgi:hypothetical protein